LALANEPSANSIAKRTDRPAAGGNRGDTDCASSALIRSDVYATDPNTHEPNGPQPCYLDYNIAKPKDDSGDTYKIGFTVVDDPNVGLTLKVGFVSLGASTDVKTTAANTITVSFKQAGSEAVPNNAAYCDPPVGDVTGHEPVVCVAPHGAPVGGQYGNGELLQHFPLNNVRGHRKAGADVQHPNPTEPQPLGPDEPAYRFAQ
jgi:hypothetical protein